MSGSTSARVAEVTASARTLPDRIFERRTNRFEHKWHLPGEKIGKRPAAIRYVEHIDPSHHLEQLAVAMSYSPDTGRRHADFARIGFGIGDQPGNGLCRE